MAVEVGDLVTAELLDLNFNPPTVQLVQAIAQTAANNNTFAVAYGTGSTVLDTDNYHSESVNNTRITPTRAGIYVVSAKAFFTATTDWRITDTYLRMNGATAVGGSSGRKSTGGTGTSSSTSVDSGILYIPFNGTTDYIEQLCVQTNATPTSQNTSVAGQFASLLNLAYHRES